MTLDEEFLANLASTKVVRISSEKYLSVFFDVYPEWRNSADLEMRVLDALKRLAANSLIRLPSEKSKVGWTRGPHKLPRWISIDKPKSQANYAPPVEHHWVPEIRDVAINAGPKLRTTLGPINDFLIRRRNNLSRVPLRERSLQLYGDEKRLDGSLKDGMLFGSKLRLEVIGAFDPPLPFAAEGPDPPLQDAPILVVENYHTYWSFVTANNTHRGYSAVAWGAGQAFAKSALGLDAVLARYSGSQILYFGDLDPRGVQIPFDVNTSRVAKGLVPITPALSLYEWLVHHGHQATTGQVRLDAKCECAARSWLGEALASQILPLWRDSIRIAQENLSFDRMDKSHFESLKSAAGA